MPVRPLSAEARKALALHRWPGNVRELENTIHRAVLLSTGPEIGVDGILTPDGARLDQSRAGTGAVAHAALAAEQMTRSLVGRTVADVERDLILETLKHCLGNRTHAANILGISIRTLAQQAQRILRRRRAGAAARGRRDQRRGVEVPPTPVGDGEPRLCHIWRDERGIARRNGPGRRPQPACRGAGSRRRR